MDDLLDLWAFDGSFAIKTLDDEGGFEGLAVPFAGHDLSRAHDRFNAGTNFGRAMKSGSDLLFYHGLPSIEDRQPNPLKDTLLGDAEFKTTDAGIWAKGVMQIRDEYETKVWEMVKAGKLGLSTGVAAHRVRREKNPDGTHTLKSWPIDELSFTPSPAHPRTSVYALKTLMLPLEAPESVGFVESLKRAESALEWAIGRELNGAKSDALKTLTETVRRYRDSRVDPAKVRAGIANVERLLTRFKD